MFYAYSQDVKTMQENARSFMMQKDHANAILILNRALDIEPNNIETRKSLALNYYLQKNYPKAIEIITPALEYENADDECFQIAGNINQSSGNDDEAEKIFRKGLKKLPGSGPLYNELGELLSEKSKSKDAIKEWEHGIEADPNYSRNYLNATRYYYNEENKIWCIIYGEIFLNLDPLNTQTPEIKSMILESYKLLFANVDLVKSNKEKNKFAESVIQIFNKQSNIAGLGINPESLTMIRTRFVLDWFNEKDEKFPFKLFEYHQQLLRAGLFDAYNQWIFGTVQNLSAYQNWTSTHAAEYNDFSKFQKNRVFKLVPGQYYH